VSASKLTTARKWLLSNFRLQIDGLDCSKVNAIDALTVTVSRADALGPTRDYPVDRAQGTQDVSNLVFTIDESNADPIRAWHQSFVIDGNNAADAEKSGTLQFLAPNLKDVLMTLTLHNLGIFKLAYVNKGGTAVPQLRAEMYCDRMDFQNFGATSAPVAYDVKDSGSSGQATDPVADAPQKVVGNIALRGNYTAGLATPPPSPAPVTNTLNLVRPLKFRS
jgi:hypothetical protein